jgi:hypothetical protein
MRSARQPPVRLPVLILAIIAGVMTVTVLRASPGPEPLDYALQAPAATEDMSNWAASSTVLVLGVLFVGGTVLSVRTWREDRRRVSSRSGAGCGKDAGALEGLPLVG